MLLELDTSERIRAARVLCILGVIYVHMPPYTGQFPPSLLSADGFFWFIRNTIGLSSVPLLSVISGYLVVRVTTPKWGVHIWKKVTSLVVPLVAWNLIALLKDYAESGEFPDMEALPNQLIALLGFPRLTPLYFLRDVFVCNLLLPAFTFLLTLNPWLSVVVLAADGIFDFDGALLLNSHIALFFFLGMALARGKLSAECIVKRRAAFAAMSCVLILLSAFLSYEIQTHKFGQSIMLVTRLSGAVLFWLAADQLRKTRIKRFEPIMFFVFCSHPLVIGAMWSVVQMLGGSHGTVLHICFFLLGPFAVLYACVVAIACLGLVNSDVLAILMGGRFPTMVQTRKMLQPWKE